MTEVFNIIKVLVGIIGMVLIVLLSMSLQGCKMSAEAEAAPVMAPRPLEMEPMPLPPTAPTPPIYAYQPQLAK